MPTSLKFYADAGLTTEITSLGLVAADDGSTGNIDKVIYLGSTVAGKQFLAASNPTVDHISFSIADGNGATGLEVTDIKLALSSGGLPPAVAGGALDLGPQLLSGAGNSVAVHLRFNPGAMAAGTYTDLSLATSTVIEVNA